jgi:tetratricopeptide (TPR) repeat protein
MKSRFSACVALTAWIVVGGLASAEEPYLKFVQGLRDHGYYDYAILYLDQVAQKPNTPELIKQIIPYQKAMTLLHSSKATRSPEKQMEQLDQALAFLEQFVKDNPDHPSAADANLDRATILLGKGQAEVQQSKAPANGLADTSPRHVKSFRLHSTRTMPSTRRILRSSTRRKNPKRSPRGRSSSRT